MQLIVHIDIQQIPALIAGQIPALIAGQMARLIAELATPLTHHQSFRGGKDLESKA